MSGGRNPASTYNDLTTEIRDLLKQIDRGLSEHRPGKRAVRWTHVGDLEYAKEQLAVVLEGFVEEKGSGAGTAPDHEVTQTFAELTRLAAKERKALPEFTREMLEEGERQIAAAREEFSDDPEVADGVRKQVESLWPYLY